MTYLLLLGGLLLLVAGGDALVRGSVALAVRFGLSPLLIGLTLVGFGTSTPELLTSVQAALAGAPGIAVGNVVGSNIANILLILGIAGAIAPLAVNPTALRRDGLAMALAALACLAIVMTGALNRPAGLALMVALVAYVAFTYLSERRHGGASADVHMELSADAPAGPKRADIAAVTAIGGLVLTAVGANLLVTGAIDLARQLQISETVIGLTLVAVGTSLPELVTAVVASLRRQGDVAFGNVLGSNIYNVLGILGCTALVQPLTVPPEIARFDIWVMLAATALLLIFATTGRRLSRIESWAFLACYAAYLAYLASAQAGAA